IEWSLETSYQTRVTPIGLDRSLKGVFSEDRSRMALLSHDRVGIPPGSRREIPFSWLTVIDTSTGATIDRFHYFPACAPAQAHFTGVPPFYRINSDLGLFINNIAFSSSGKYLIT